MKKPFISLVLLPWACHALEQRGDDGVLLRGAMISQESSYKQPILLHDRQLVASKEHEPTTPTCPVALATCEASYTTGSLNYEGMSTFLSQLHPSSGGAVEKFQELLKQGAQFDGSTDLFQELNQLTEDEAKDVVTQLSAANEQIQQQVNVLQAFSSAVSAGDDDHEITENTIESLVQEITNIVVFFNNFYESLPIVGPVFAFVNNILGTLYRALLAPLLTTPTFYILLGVVAGLVIIPGLFAAIIAFFSFNTQGLNGSGKNQFDGQGGFRRLDAETNDDDDDDGLECLSKLLSCQVEKFLAENSASMLELAVLSDANAP